MSEKLSRRDFEKLLLSVAVASTLPTSASSQQGKDFAHPGMLHTGADLARMRDGVRSRMQPIFSGYEAMSANAGSQLNYKSRGASPEIGRNPTIHAGEFDADSNAAYQCALMWTITGNRDYARLAIVLVDAWTSTLKKITGADAVLCASLGGFKFVNAAELLRHTASGWSEADAKRCEGLMRDVFLPVIANFSPFANGNWDTAAIKLMMAIGIYCEDSGLFDRAVNYYLHGCGDGRLNFYIYSNGECQESGRDQQHTQLGLAHMGDVCEMAWHQGLDLYNALDNRLLLGFEYTARYELGEEVPFDPDVDRTGKYRHTVISARSPLRNNFEQIFNHYVQRKGLVAPWTTKAAARVRPEGAPFGADATGYGTLLYSRPAGKDEAGFAGAKTVVYADGSHDAVTVDFVPIVGAARYEVLRGAHVSGPFRAVVSNVVGSDWRDASALPSQLYFYRVRATGSREMSAVVPQMRGLPAGWEPRSVGVDVEAGAGASFDGSSYRLFSGKPAKAVPFGPYHSIERSLPANAEMAVRVLPLVASQSIEVGLIVHGEAAYLKLLLSPKGGQLERPRWSAMLVEQAGVEDAKVIGQQAMGEPTITWGRISQPVWLRMAATDGMVKAAISLDGTAWQEVGAVESPKGPLRVGMFVASGIAGMGTEVVFDRVTAS